MAEDKSDVVERLQAEAADMERTEPPAGAPALKEFHNLPRKIRAEVADSIAALMPQVNKFADAPTPDPEKATEADVMVALDQVGDMYRMLADIEETLTKVAVEPEPAAAWMAAASDQDLMQLFGYFAGGFSLGEASSSSS